MNKKDSGSLGLKILLIVRERYLWLFSLGPCRIYVKRTGMLVEKFKLNPKGD